jgi:hypothetical protein
LKRARLHDGIAIFVAVFCVCSLLAAGAHGFYQFHNDYWDTYLAARRLAWNDATTWFNGQYPIANLLVTRAFMVLGNPVPPAIVVNILLAAVALYLIGRLSRRMLSPAWAAFAVVIIAVFPEFVRYSNAAGGDPAATLLFTAAIAVVFWELLDPTANLSDRVRTGRWVFAGILMGGAGLFRYHAFVGGALWAVAAIVALRGRRRAGVWLGLGLVIGFAPQWVVNVVAGRGLFETGFGPMNVYHLMYGMNWQRITDLEVAGSAFDVIAGDPVLFLKHYLISLASFKHIWIPPIVAFLLSARGTGQRRAFRLLALWICVYFLVFSATSSGRQGLLALPVAMLALGFVLQTLWNRSAESVKVPTGSLRIGLVLICCGLVLLHVNRDVRWWRARAAQSGFAREAELVLSGAGVTRAAAVFTTDYDLYFAGFPDLVTRSNGGAVRLGTDWYNAVYPEFPVDNLTLFAQSARAGGVDFIALDDAAYDLSEPLGRLRAKDTDTAGFHFLGRTAHYNLYRVP